jgi:hypothetical protein
MVKLTEAPAALWAKLVSSAGVTVSITRDGIETGNIIAVPGASQVLSVDEENIQQTYKMRDYLIPVTSYAVASTAVEPLQGDLITEEGVEYEVQAVAGERPYDFVHQFQNTPAALSIYRVHTKQVA